MAENTLTPISFDTEFREDDKRYYLQKFVSIVEWKVWEKRLAELKRRQKSSPFMENYISERHALVLEINNTFEHMRKYGRLPASRNAYSQYALFAFIAPFVEIYSRLSLVGKKRLRGMLIDGIKSDKGLAPLALEVSTIAMMVGDSYTVFCNDIENEGGYDFLMKNNDVIFEVECKSIGTNYGNKIERAHVNDISSQIFKRLLDTLNKATKPTLKIVRVTYEGRSTSNHRAVELLCDDIISAIDGAAIIQRGDAPKIEIIERSFEKSPFAELSRTNEIEDIARTYLEIELGIGNPHMFCIGDPGLGAFVVVFESRKGNDVIKYLHRDIKESAKKQLSGDMPGIFLVKFEDLTSEELMRLSENSGDDIRTANGLQIIVSAIFDDSRFKHVLGVAFMAQEHFYVDQSPGGIILPGTVYGQGQTYAFYNENCSVYGDPRYRFLKE